jgi:hypothetical protein
VPWWISTPQAYSRVSNINFDILISFGVIQYTLATDGKVLSHLGFMSKVLSGPLTDLITWVGF